MKNLIAVASVFAIIVSAPCAAREVKPFVVVNADVGVPVFPHDLKDRKYEVLGEVKAGVRKATAFSKSPSQAKIYRELWERADKLGADAVINASYGDAHISAFSWGKTNATGTAIRFTGTANATNQATLPATSPTTPATSAPAGAAPLSGTAPTPSGK
jgi:uncharacterized protein YbjQ (UPF0145 family)